MKYLRYSLIFVGLLVMAFLVYRHYSEKDQTTTNVKNIPPKNITGTHSATNDYKIVAFGDSLTAGYGVSLDESYPSILEEKLKQEAIVNNKHLNITVVNMGVSGETTAGGLERVDFIIAQNPDLILLGLGANDMLRAVNPQTTKDNLDSIVKTITDKKIPVILMGMQSQAGNGFSYKRDFDDIYPALAKKYTLPLIPFILKGVALVPSLNTSDGIHPNRAGYEKIVQDNIMPVLLDYLKK